MHQDPTRREFFAASGRSGGRRRRLLLIGGTGCRSTGRRNTRVLGKQ